MTELDWEDCLEKNTVKKQRLKCSSIKKISYKRIFTIKLNYSLSSMEYAFMLGIWI
jgi:hypothetical protein